MLARACAPRLCWCPLLPAFSPHQLNSTQTSLLGELRELGASISRDIFLESPNVQFNQIAGLQEAKQ